MPVTIYNPKNVNGIGAFNDKINPISIDKSIGYSYHSEIANIRPIEVSIVPSRP